MELSQQQKEQIVLELRKLSDWHRRDFSGLLLKKSTAELKKYASALRIEYGPAAIEQYAWSMRVKPTDLGFDERDNDRAELALRQMLMNRIREVMLQVGGYLYIEGRLEVLGKGDGFLRDVHVAQNPGFRQAGQYDNYDVYVPRQLIVRSRLKNGDIVAGIRRWPYPGEEHLVLLELSEVKS